MSIIKKLIVVFCLPMFACATVHPAPTISSITGTFTDGGSVTVSGTGYGTKSPAAPIRWAPFSSSSDASSLGQGTSWNQIQNVSWVSGSGYGSSGGMQGTAGSGTWTMRVDASGFNWNDNGQKWYVFRRAKQNYIVPTNATNNQKNFRVWPAGGTGYSNLYWSIQNGRIFVENIGGSTDSGFWASGVNPNTTNWYAEEIICQASSSSGVKDGTLKLMRDGTQRANGNIISKSAAAPAGWVSMYPLHIVIANKGQWTGPAWSTSNNTWFDDVYVDKTWQRVMIGDASTFANSRKFGFIVPATWSDTGMTGTLQIHSNDFPAQTTAYAYVFDTSNAPNSAGKAFVIGGAAAGNPPPAISSVIVSTGNANGTTVSTMTGTGFQVGLTVLVGTSTATGITYLNSTAVQFTIPPGTAGTTGLDLVAINPDTQSSTLLSTMSYTATVVNQPPYDVVAGDDREITLPSSTTFSGAALDDGLPSASLTYLWAQKSGPGTINFISSTALVTEATFSSSGTYTVSLTANDSALSTESPIVTITVNPVVIPAGPSEDLYNWGGLQ